MIVVHAYLYAEPEHREAFAEGLRLLRESTLALDTGCLEYSFWSGLDEPDRFVCVERWADRASLEAHLAAGHHARAGEILDQIRARPAQIQVFEAEPVDL